MSPYINLQYNIGVTPISTVGCNKSMSPVNMCLIYNSDETIPTFIILAGLNLKVPNKRQIHFWKISSPL